MSSDSDSDRKIKTKATKKGKSEKQDFQIKPSSGGASLDTSKWPLLLKVKSHITYNSYLSEL
jgi:hypothetical protein